MKCRVIIWVVIIQQINHWVQRILKVIIILAFILIIEEGGKVGIKAINIIIVVDAYCD